jgi:ComF family protein
MRIDCSDRSRSILIWRQQASNSLYELCWYLRGYCGEPAEFWVVFTVFLSKFRNFIELIKFGQIQCLNDLFMIYKSLLNLFLKSQCPLCDRHAETELCLYCQRQIQRCQLANPSQFWQTPLPVLAWGEYGGQLKMAIAAMKYENHPQLAKPLGQWLGQAWRNSPQNQQAGLTIVPIPMHPDKRQERGFDQAELLAQSFCRVTGFPLEKRGLQRVRQTQALFSLSPEQRQQEVADAFDVGAGFRRQPSGKVLLLDDIYTTGATARAAVTALKRRGIRVSGVVAMATTVR